jgi:hypothetical protein
MTRQDWVCSVKWVQATPTTGGWYWKLWLVKDDKPQGQKQPDDTILLKPLAEGVATTKLGVYWQVFWACRKNGLRFRPNVRGTIPEKDND